MNPARYGDDSDYVARDNGRCHANVAMRYTPPVPKLTRLVLVLTLIVQVFWTGVAHGCQRDLLPGTAQCGVCAGAASAHDRGDNSDDSAGSDACSACHIVSLQVDFATSDGIFVTARRAPAPPILPVYAYDPADGPERPKWGRAA